MYEWAGYNLSPQEGGWLAGFVAGEGCFLLHIREYDSWYADASFEIQMREDDRIALEEIERLWQLKCSIYEKPQTRSVRLRVGRVATLRNRIVATFRLYPLRARKQRDFDIWAEAIEILYQKQVESRKYYNPWEKNRLTEIAKALTLCKKFNPEEPNDQEA